LAVELLQRGLDPASTPAERKVYVERAVAEAAEAVRAEYLRMPAPAIRALEAANALALPSSGAPWVGDRPAGR
jgi:hypothetical protein